MWDKIKKWLMVSWVGVTIASIPLVSVTLFQLTIQPTLQISVNNIPGVNGEKSKDPFSVPNAEGKDVRFSIWTLSADYSWEVGYDGTNDEGYPARLNEGNEILPILSKQKDGLNLAEEIICIGASSQEFKSGSVKNQEAVTVEEDRAGRRANSIAKWIRPELNVPLKEPDSVVVRLLKNLGVMSIIEYFAGKAPPPPQRLVKKLNIGQWVKPQLNRTPKETEDQRRVVIVLVLRNEKGEYVPPDDVALRNAFQVKGNNGEPIYSYILNEYSKTKNGSFIWEK
jgi:hypothetical protein